MVLQLSPACHPRHWHYKHWLGLISLHGIESITLLNDFHIYHKDERYIILSCLWSGSDRKLEVYFFVYTWSNSLCIYCYVTHLIYANYWIGKYLTRKYLLETEIQHVKVLEIYKSLRFISWHFLEFLST